MFSHVHNFVQFNSPVIVISGHVICVTYAIPQKYLSIYGRRCHKTTLRTIFWVRFFFFKYLLWLWLKWCLVRLVFITGITSFLLYAKETEIRGQMFFAESTHEALPPISQIQSASAVDFHAGKNWHLIYCKMWLDSIVETWWILTFIMHETPNS